MMSHIRCFEYCDTLLLAQRRCRVALDALHDLNICHMDVLDEALMG